MKLHSLLVSNTLTQLVPNTLTLTDGKNLVVQHDAFAIALKWTVRIKRLLYEDRYILIFAATLSLLKRLWMPRQFFFITGKNRADFFNSLSCFVQTCSVGVQRLEKGIKICAIPQWSQMVRKSNVWKCEIVNMSFVEEKFTLSKFAGEALWFVPAALCTCDQFKLQLVQQLHIESSKVKVKATDRH